MEGAGGLHGRRDELERLEEAVARAAAGRGSAVVLRGDPGIGKTRLLAALADLAEEAGFSVRTGRGDELGQGRPFGPIAQALDLRPASADPELAGVGRLLAGDGELDHAGLPLAAELRFRVLDTVLEAVDRATAGQPLAVVVDDAHWADEDSVRVLAALAERAPQLPLLVAFATRRHPVGPVLATTLQRVGDSGAAVLDLSPLAPDGVAGLVADLVEGRPGPDLLDEVARAGGNPFLAIELVTAHSAAGALVADRGRVELATGADTVSLGRTVLRRLDHLRPGTVELLRTASVLGRTFALPILADLTGRRVADLGRDVQEALEAGLVQPAGPDLVFSHDLVREAVYDELPVAVRSALHRDAAQALAAAHASAFDVATQVERSAAHDTQVVGWLLEGARQVRVTAPATAVSFLRRAAEDLTPADGAWLDVQALLAEALVFSGATQEGLERARQCLEQTVVPETERARLAYLMGQGLFLAGRLPEAAAAFARSADTGADRAGSLADGALTLLLGGDLDGAGAMAEEALRAAREAGDAAVEAFVLATTSWIRALEGDLAEGLELGRRAVTVADSLGGLEAQRNVPWLLYAQVLLWADRDAEAELAIARATELGERLGLVWDQPLRHLLRARALHRAGEWDEALAEARAGLSLAADQGGSIAEVWLRCVVARLAVARGDIDEATAALDAATSAAAVSGQGADQVAWSGALLAEAQGDAASAAFLLGALWDGVAERGLDYYVWDIAPDVVRVALAAGESDRVHRVVATVEAIARRSPDSSAPLVAVRCRGLADGDPDALLDALRRLDHRKGGSRPVERATLQVEAAALLDAAGRTAEARDLRTEAEPVLHRAGVPVPPAAAAGGRPAGGSTGTARFGWEALTTRELEVVGLLTESLSNVEIAERLQCSRRTVESHLSHVYTKLGLSSRVELALEAARRLDGDP